MKKRKENDLFKWLMYSVYCYSRSTIYLSYVPFFPLSPYDYVCLLCVERSTMFHHMGSPPVPFLPSSTFFLKTFLDNTWKWAAQQIIWFLLSPSTKNKSRNKLVPIAFHFNNASVTSNYILLFCYVFTYPSFSVLVFVSWLLLWNRFEGKMHWLSFDLFWYF